MLRKSWQLNYTMRRNYSDMNIYAQLQIHAKNKFLKLSIVINASDQAIEVPPFTQPLIGYIYAYINYSNGRINDERVSVFMAIAKTRKLLK